MIPQQIERDKMLYLDEKQVAEVLNMKDLIPVMGQTMIDFSQGRITQPTRRMFDIEPYRGFFGSMPAATSNSVGAKLLTFYPGNADKNIPTHMALIVLFRKDTGEPVVVMDGRLITEMRTAAVTATFFDCVCDMDPGTLAVLGAGTQAKSHIEALQLIRPFRDIIIWNRTPARAEQLASQVGASTMPLQQAVESADVVVLTTSATTPVIKGSWLRPGTKVASVGWAGADSGELDAVTMANTVIVDSRAGALAESGNVRRFNADIFAELGEILADSSAVDKSKTVVFDSIGMACQDIATAKFVYDRVLAR
jgi:thiomorpholine-carboxylate dehydrogenase